MASKMKINKSDYHSLNPMAKELHDYWMNFKPKMYKELADRGNLLELVQREGNRLNEMVIELTPQIGLAGAKEVARAEIYDETDEETEEEQEEMTEQDKRNAEMWEAYVQTMEELREMERMEQRRKDEEEYEMWKKSEENAKTK